MEANACDLRRPPSFFTLPQVSRHHGGDVYLMPDGRQGTAAAPHAGENAALVAERLSEGADSEARLDLQARKADTSDEMESVAGEFDAASCAAEASMPAVETQNEAVGAVGAADAPVVAVGEVSNEAKVVSEECSELPVHNVGAAASAKDGVGGNASSDVIADSAGTVNTPGVIACAGENAALAAERPSEGADSEARLDLQVRKAVGLPLAELVADSESATLVAQQEASQLRIVPTPRTGSCLFAGKVISGLNPTALCSWISAPRHANGVAMDRARAQYEREVCVNAAIPYIQCLEGSPGKAARAEEIRREHVPEDDEYSAIFQSMERTYHVYFFMGGELYRSVYNPGQSVVRVLYVATHSQGDVTSNKGHFEGLVLCGNSQGTTVQIKAALDDGDVINDSISATTEMQLSMVKVLFCNRHGLDAQEVAFALGVTVPDDATVQLLRWPSTIAIEAVPSRPPVLSRPLPRTPDRRWVEMSRHVKALERRVVALERRARCDSGAQVRGACKLNAFQLWCRDERKTDCYEELKVTAWRELGEGNRQKRVLHAISKKLGKKWSRLGEDAKRPYYDAAAAQGSAPKRARRE